MNNVKNQHIIIKIFQQFQNQKISARELVNKWPNSKDNLDPLEEEFLHKLDHYIADMDIHEKEPEYKKIQLKEIQVSYNDLISRF